MQKNNIWISIEKLLKILSSFLSLSKSMTFNMSFIVISLSNGWI